MVIAGRTCGCAQVLLTAVLLADGWASTATAATQAILPQACGDSERRSVASTLNQM